MFHPSGNPLALLVENLELHSDLSPEDRQAVLDLPHRIRAFESSSYLVSEGERPTNCAVLLSGFAYRQKQTSGGKRQIVSIHIPGEALDFQHLFLGVADHSIQMLTAGDVALIARRDLHAIIDARPMLHRAITRRILVEASIFREWVLNVGRRDARSRMAHLLCEFAVRMRVSGLAGDHGYELPITQDQFADAVGLTTVHVNRTLQSLGADGFVKRAKRAIFIPSWKRLAEIGDFNERYLHLKSATPGRRSSQ
ncbi:MAG: Crp/Fnr family transcriptional regulator [Brevundimonas sp.]